MPAGWNDIQFEKITFPQLYEQFNKFTPCTLTFTFFARFLQSFDAIIISFAAFLLVFRETVSLTMADTLPWPILLTWTPVTPVTPYFRGGWNMRSSAIHQDDLFVRKYIHQTLALELPFLLARRSSRKIFMVVKMRYWLVMNNDDGEKWVNDDCQWITLMIDAMDGLNEIHGDNAD